MNKASLFKKHIALPQDHGSWVFLFSPLLVGLFSARHWSLATLSLVVGALAAFLIRQPITILVKIRSKRRRPADRPAALFWAAVYGVVALAALAHLLYLGHGYLLYLAAPAIPVFGWHLYLVSRRAERRQAGLEIVASGVLALAAPAALWLGEGGYDPRGWQLWLLLWLQSAASIVYAYFRLAQREMKTPPSPAESWRMGGRALLYTSFNLVLSIALSLVHLAPRGLFVPYLLQWAETIWGITHPATGQKPTRIGVRQLIVSSLFTLLFILVWR